MGKVQGNVCDAKGNYELIYYFGTNGGSHEIGLRMPRCCDEILPSFKKLFVTVIHSNDIIFLDFRKTCYVSPKFLCDLGDIPKLGRKVVTKGLGPLIDRCRKCSPALHRRYVQ